LAKVAATTCHQERATLHGPITNEALIPSGKVGTGFPPGGVSQKEINNASRNFTA
jgi:hypothetical protein